MTDTVTLEDANKAADQLKAAAETASNLRTETLKSLKNNPTARVGVIEAYVKELDGIVARFQALESGLDAALLADFQKRNAGVLDELTAQRDRAKRTVAML
jgi:hypothetical protein